MHNLNHQWSLVCIDSPQTSSIPCSGATLFFPFLLKYPEFYENKWCINNEIRNMYLPAYA